MADNTYNVNEVINGLYGYLYDENGLLLQETKEFEFAAEFEKEELKIPGQFFSKHKVMGGSLSGSLTMNKRDSRLAAKILENPTAKYNYLGKLADPDAKGNEAVLIKGLSFNGADIIKWALGEITEIEADFTADDSEYKQQIA
jgi:hypothetical protein